MTVFLRNLELLDTPLLYHLRSFFVFNPKLAYPLFCTDQSERLTRLQQWTGGYKMSTVPSQKTPSRRNSFSSSDMTIIHPGKPGFFVSIVAKTENRKEKISLRWNHYDSGNQNIFKWRSSARVSQESGTTLPEFYPDPTPGLAILHTFYE